MVSHALFLTIFLVYMTGTYRQRMAHIYNTWPAEGWLVFPSWLRAKGVYRNAITIQEGAGTAHAKVPSRQRDLSEQLF